MTGKRRRDGTPTSDRQDARGYSWPPFEPGNTVSVRHGGFSDRLVSERAKQVRALLFENYPYLADDVFAEALERYCRAEARAQMLHEWIMAVVEGSVEVAPRNGRPRTGVEAVPPYLWSEASRAEANAQKFGQDIGLDPIGHVRIARDLGLVARLRGQPGGGVEALARKGNALRLLQAEKGP